jgi:hypothetical protein
MFAGNRHSGTSFARLPWRGDEALAIAGDLRHDVAQRGGTPVCNHHLACRISCSLMALSLGRPRS